jgi:hypothetical protein
MEHRAGAPGVAFCLETGEAELPEPRAIQFVWRGDAEDEDAAALAARQAWEERYRTWGPQGAVTILEIEPEDIGYANPWG